MWLKLSFLSLKETKQQHQKQMGKRALSPNTIHFSQMMRIVGPVEDAKTFKLLPLYVYALPLQFLSILPLSFLKN